MLGSALAQDVWMCHFLGRTKEQIKKIYSFLPQVTISICSCSQLGIYSHQGPMCVYMYIPIGS